MNIITLPFEESLKLNVNGEIVELIAFKTLEHGNIKFGVNASRSVKVHREEVAEAIRLKELESSKE